MKGYTPKFPSGRRVSNSMTKFRTLLLAPEDSVFTFDDIKKSIAKRNKHYYQSAVDAILALSREGYIKTVEDRVYQITPRGLHFRNDVLEYLRNTGTLR